MSRTRARGAAAAIRKKVETAGRNATMWREEATTIVGGWLVKTTTYDDLDDTPVESAETWAWLDTLDEPQVADEVVLTRMGERPVVIGKLVRAASVLARITRTVRMQSNYWIESYGTTPSGAAGAGAGTGATVSIEGTDNKGKVLITTGTGTAAGVAVRVTFATPKSTSNYTVMLTPADSDAADARPYHNYVNNTTTYFEIQFRVAPVISTSHHVNYEIGVYEA